jgi:CheY-like chemotaxis protein
MLQSGLSAAAPGTRVVNVPSAEEALLVANSRRFDVLIIDVLLPGMSGLALLERLKIRQPEARTILVTGTVDNEVRKRVANAGADAFFFKPLDVTAVLDTVALYLSPAAPPMPAVPAALPLPEKQEARPESLDERLAGLRQVLGAQSVLLLDDRGQAMIQAGGLPPGLDPKALYPALMGAFSAAARVSATLGARPPEDVLVFYGGEIALYLAHVGETVALVAAVRKSSAAGAESVIPQIQKASIDLRPLLENIGLPAEPPAEQSPPAEPEQDSLEEDPAAAEELDELLKGAGELALSAEEIDAFWKAPDKSMDTGSLNPDNLSYDQARKIGLAPEEE